MKTPHSCKRENQKGVFLGEPNPALIGKKIALVGYSVRALNYVAKYAGLKTFAIDCFADMDLRRLADKFIEVNLDQYRNEKGKLEHEVAFYLCKVIKENFSEISSADYLVLGSSFENSPLWWDMASRSPNYYGTNPTKAWKVRNPLKFYQFLTENTFHFPSSLIFYEVAGVLHSVLYGYDEAGKALNSIPNIRYFRKIAEKTEGSIKNLYHLASKTSQFPLVLKSAHSGGGLGIKLIQSETELEEKYQEMKQVRDPPYVLQEYIEGIPMSCSVIANGKRAKVYTLSHQIIGEHRFGCRGDFTYCGNIMNREISDPNSPNNANILPELEKIANKLTEFAHLQGSFGIDFVLKQGRIYLMEVNPRFQGTIDLILNSTGENIVFHHINSLETKRLPDDIRFPDDKTYLKAIYYSPLDFHIMVDLQGLDFFDTPLIGSYLPQAAPICSNIIVGDNIENAYSKALDDRDLMLRVLGLKARISENEPILNR